MPKETASSATYDVSEDMFEIITEAIYLHSNNTKKFQSLRSVVEQSAEKLQPGMFIADHFQAFIQTVPLSGKHRIHLRVQTSINERLSHMKQKLEEISGVQVFDRTAVAYFVQLCIEKKLY